MHTIGTLIALFFAPAFAAAEPWSIPQEHPRLLIHRDELPAIRKRCGLPEYRDAPPAAARFASQMTAFERLRRVADHAARVGANPGELYATALAHLVLGDVARQDKYVERVESELRRALEHEWQEDDAIIALDWCWDALRPEVRDAMATRLATRLQPLSSDVSPFDHIVLHPRICDVAAAIVIFDPRAAGRDDPTSKRIRGVLAAATAYLEGPFAQLWQQKGPAPVRRRTISGPRRTPSWPRRSGRPAPGDPSGRGSPTRSAVVVTCQLLVEHRTRRLAVRLSVERRQLGAGSPRPDARELARRGAVGRGGPHGLGHCAMVHE